MLLLVVYTIVQCGTLVIIHTMVNEKHWHIISFYCFNIVMLLQLLMKPTSVLSYHQRPKLVDCQGYLKKAFPKLPYTLGVRDC